MAGYLTLAGWGCARRLRINLNSMGEDIIAAEGVKCFRQWFRNFNRRTVARLKPSPDACPVACSDGRGKYAAAERNAESGEAGNACAVGTREGADKRFNGRYGAAMEQGTASRGIHLAATRIVR